MQTGIQPDQRLCLTQAGMPVKFKLGKPDSPPRQWCLSLSRAAGSRKAQPEYSSPLLATPCHTTSMDRAGCDQ